MLVFFEKTILKAIKVNVSEAPGILEITVSFEGIVIFHKKWNWPSNIQLNSVEMPDHAQHLSIYPETAADPRPEVQDKKNNG